MTGTHWIVEGRIDPRWPINTRGNIGEVFPEVLTPLTYELGVKPAEAGWREAYSMMGVLHDRDFSSTEPVIIGLYGGYGYLNLSYLRMLGVRAPGSSPQAIDVAFFGEGNPPPYEPRPGDRRIGSTFKIARTVLKALGQDRLPEAVADSELRVERWEDRQPHLATASDEVLLRYLHDYPAVLQPVFRNHMITSGIAAIVAGVLSDAATAAGQPGLVTKLLGTVDEVVSAQYSHALWSIAQIVQRTPAVAAEFDRGVDGIAERLDALDDAGAEVRTAFATFIAHHGHRGPNDWELSARTWENTPELAYVAIDRMRLSQRDLSVPPIVVDTVAERAEAARAVLPHVKGLDRVNFRKALRAAPWWARGREATRDLAIRCHNPVRRTFFELARRARDRGGVATLRDVAMLDPIVELPRYVADPGAYVTTIRERAALRDRFAKVTPPFFITSQDDVPSIEELEAQQVVAVASHATPGTVLSGAPGCAGIARGRARVVLDPADPAGLEPGDVLVAPLTDPAWTPLFMPAAAVVVNVGALMSHAVIVSRELGIPCVVAVDSATDRIPDGAMVEVDGERGTVVVLADA
jgi:pyruvate,water dikinase